MYKKLFNVPELNQMQAILTGVSAGSTEAFVVVSFDLVKIRLQDRASVRRHFALFLNHHHTSSHWAMLSRLANIMAL